MENFVSIIWTEGELNEDAIVESLINLGSMPLNEDGTNYQVGETVNGEHVLRIAISEALEDEASHALAEAIAAEVFDMGLTNFDIEISARE
jgi:hypothetical protein